jgi:spore coat protein A
MDRRRFLELGAATAASAVAARALGPWWEGAGAASPVVTPFAQDLLIPAVATPDVTDDADVYELELRAASASVLPGLTTEIWGYDGRWPGPTIVAEAGRPVRVTFTSSLAVDTAIHLHGGHVAPEDDGHPMDPIAPGASRTYHYPNAQPHSTLWYHDHAMMRTAENIYRGLAGLYLLHDEQERGLGLPSGDHDVPLLLQDRTFRADGSLDYPAMGDPRRRDGVTGDVFLVNGVPFPRFEVDRSKYRFRVVNGSNSPSYELRLARRSLTQIGSDGGLLAAPVSVQTVTVGIAERVELIIDFSGFDAGDTIELQDAISDRAIMRFDVQSGSTASAVPTTLRTIDALPAPSRARELRFTLDEAQDAWVLNGKPFDLERIDFRPRLGETERWRLVNDSSFVHPFHLHLVQFRVVQRGLANPTASERGWKDTVRINPGETVTIDAQFTDHVGTYVFHCHVLEHEDHSMMGQLRIVDLARRAGATRVATAVAVSAAAFPDGARRVFVATARSFADALAGGPAAANAGGPLLLVDGSLSAETAAEIDRLAPDEIVVLGGTGAVPASVETELAAHAPVRRVSGSDRYATAAATARLVPSPATVFVASGTAFADALAGGAAVAALGGVLLLTERDHLPTATVDALSSIGRVPIAVLGGTAAVADSVLDELAPFADGAVVRLGGQDRYETSVRVSERTFAEGADVAYIATGTAFPDALAAAPAAAVDGAPLLLTDPEVVPDGVLAELRRLAVSRIVVLGGPGAVSVDAEDQLGALL